jgi:hypothetical protein
MGKILKGSRLPTQQTNSWRRSPLTFAAQAHTHTMSESSAFHNPKVKVREREGGPAVLGVHRTA